MWRIHRAVFREPRCPCRSAGRSSKPPSPWTSQSTTYPPGWQRTATGGMMHSRENRVLRRLSVLTGRLGVRPDAKGQGALMPPRSIGSLTVSFGLVAIPVKLYTATQSASAISFNLLHKSDGSRLKQQYLCQKEGVVVERDEMVKGYEFAKDQYVLFSPEEIKALEEVGTHSVEISEFVPIESIDPVYFDKTYYLAPDKGASKRPSRRRSRARKSRSPKWPRKARARSSISWRHCAPVWRDPRVPARRSRAWVPARLPSASRSPPR